MNALTKASMDGEVLEPCDMVRAIGKTHPLSGGRIDSFVRAGSSITEILLDALGERHGLVLRRDFVVHIDGHVIEEKNWARVRVKKGATVTFTPRLQGGSALRSVLGVVLAVAAIALAVPTGGLSLGLVAATGISASVASALIAGGIILAGTMALNALFPVRPPSASSDNVNSTSLNSIQGAQNQSNPFGPIPVVLGTHRQSPYYAAKPYTEILGDDQHLRLYFCMGYGPLNMTDFKIGETPLTSFSDYQIEVRQGFVGDAAVTLYPGSVDEVSLSITLSNTIDAPGVNGGNGAWQSQTTAAETDEITLDFTATEGCFKVNDQSGNLDNWTIVISTRYREVGTVSWTNVVDVSIGRSTSPTRIGVQLGVTRGQYEVQVRKALGDGASDKIKDTIVWTALRSIKQAPPISFQQPLALVAIRIKASDQLSGVVNTFNCVCTSLVKAYSGAVWSDNTASQFPPDLFRHALQGPANARPVDDGLIDLDSLQDWWTYCVSKGFKFNQVRNTVSSVSDALDDICASGRAVKTFIDGKWGVFWDRPEDSIVQHFTPRNSWGFQGQKPYTQKPHGWRVSFINETNGFTQDERIVYDDGFDATNATLFEGIQFPGVTDPALIWKHGRFHIAQSRLRPEKISLNVGWEHLVCTKGDRVRVTHDVLLIGLASGRLKSVVGQVVTFDEEVTIESGKTYGMQFRVPEDVRTIDRAINPATAAGDYKQLTLVGDLSGLKAGNLFGFGETDQESADYRIQSISPQGDLVALLTLVDDAPAISTADSGPIPAYNPNVTIPPDPFELPPRDLKYLELIEGQGAGLQAEVALSWQVPRFGKISSFEVQQRDDNSVGPWVTVDTVLPPGTSSIVTLAAAGVWSFRVRCLFSDGTASDWVTLDHLSLLGLARPPDPVANLRNTFISGRSYLSWDMAVDPRNVLVEVRKGSSFAVGQIVTDAATSPWQTVGDDLYWLTSYVVSPFGDRIYSSPLQSIEIAGSVATQNVVVSHDERAENWVGTFSGSVGIDQANNFLRTSTGDDFLGRTDFLGTGNFIDGDGKVQTGGIYWSPTTVNAGGVSFCRVSNDWTATGVAATDDFLGNPDFLGNLDFLKASLSQFVRVRPIIRVSLVGPVPTWGPVQIWSPDVYQGWMFQLGMQFEILTDQVADPGAIAYLLSWIWTVDVPDRLDSYQNLTVPIGGTVINFRPIGAGVDKPFSGGLNNEPLPHLTPSIRNPAPGVMVVWSALTLSSVRISVVDGSGTDVGGSEVNVLAYGY